MINETVVKKISKKNKISIFQNFRNIIFCLCFALFFFSGSGNVMHDMELQIKANILRIELLEKQNQTLRLTLKKMNEKYELHLSNEEVRTPRMCNRNNFCYG